MLEIKNEFKEHIEVTNKTLEILNKEIKEASGELIKALRNHKKIILFGNGGSASDAQHIAAELVGRYKSERIALPAIALNTDTSIMTAVGNDYGYDEVFRRQVEALCNPGDVVIGISTSGMSLNVINALKSSKKIGCINLGLSGKDGGDMTTLCDYNLIIPSQTTARIQEMHILIGHIFCQLIDNEYSDV
jgi:D-sedoheptulose 7-phosphate isomerase